MYFLISILLIPVIVFLVVVLFALLFAWAWVRKTWYSITGKKPREGFQSTSYNNTHANANTHAKEENASQQKNKIFSKNDGEYVDFEIVE